MEKEDRKGYAVDPTANVLQLVEAAVDRLDDLRASELRRIDEQMELREIHAKELREAEAKRIDAIRAVDVNAVAVASERASAQASVLATQVAQSADALRNLVSSTAATMAAQQDTLTKQFNDRISMIEKSQYENKGKSEIADPMMDKYFAKMDVVLAKLSEGKGTSGGRKEMYGWFAGGIMLLIAIATALSKFGVL